MTSTSHRKVADAKTPSTMRRGRPTPEQAAKIADKILAKARELFLSQGYAETSMDAVALAASVSKPTLYSRFPTKPDLFEAIVRDRLSVWRTDGETDYDAEDMPIGDWLNLVAVRHLAAFSSPEVRAFDHLLLSEAPRFPELARSFYALGYRGAVLRVANRLAAAGRPNGEPTQNAETIAHLLISGLLGWHRMEAMLRDVTADERRQFAERIVALTMQGRAAW